MYLEPKSDTVLRILLRFFLLLFFFIRTFFLMAQIHAVEIQVTVMPPYSPYFSDYISYQNHTLLTLSTTSTFPLQIALDAEVKGDNGIQVMTNPTAVHQMVQLSSQNSPMVLTGAQLAQIFDPPSFTYQNITQQEIIQNGTLPEGNYQICVRATDFVTHAMLGEQGCSNFFSVSYVQPPIITNPVCGTHIQQTVPQGIIFNWTPAVGSQAQVNYSFKLAEVPNSVPNINDVLNLNYFPYLFYIDNLIAPTLFYGPGDPQLEPGKHYVVRVQAYDPANLTMIQSNGFSAPCDFFYDVLPNPIPTGDTIPVTENHPGTTTTNNPRPRDTTHLTEPPHRPDTTVVPPQIPVTPTCYLTTEEKMEPKMDGGLMSSSKKSDYAIDRDQFITLHADGDDWDELIQYCKPVSSCPESESEQHIPLNGRVKFEWEFIDGEGDFVQLGCIAPTKKEQGDFTIFMPPYVPLPEKNPDTTLVTHINLKVIDDNPTQPGDLTVERIITIKTARKKAVPDKYYMTVESPSFTKPGAPKTENKDGTCQYAKPEWKNNKDLKTPTIVPPPVADNDKLVLGEYMILYATDQRDNDELILRCNSKKCTSSEWKKTYEDNLTWDWKIEKGRGTFVDGDGDYKTSFSGPRYVIYKAPDDTDKGKDFFDVVVSVNVRNRGGSKIADEVPKEPGKYPFRVFKPGIRMDNVDARWLPEDKNETPLRSYLVYKDGGWNPALAHQCRIHFIEAMDISQEPGLSMNTPIKKNAKKCNDLLFRETGDWEMVGKKDDMKCDTAYYWTDVRSKKPVQEFRTNIYSRDFGAFGFARAFANVVHKHTSSKSTKPEYTSVTLKKNEVNHPSGKTKKKEYPDNRVTIPKDEDENHICDNGYKVSGGAKVADDSQDTTDADATPVGDSFNGDGLSNYQEYRGFFVCQPAVQHERTDPKKKNIFVGNLYAYPLTLFQTISSLDVLEVNNAQMNDSSRHEINFNNKTAHNNLQNALLLIRRGASNDGTVGIAHTTNVVGGNKWPAPPNWVTDVTIYQTNLNNMITGTGVNANNETLRVIAHELSHGCNVYHHGEGKDFFKVSGLCSGNVSCVMYYDNCIQVLRPEVPGTTLCVNGVGTGHNAAGQPNPNQGNAAAGRGNCVHQIRVSGRDSNYPKRP